MTPNLNLASMYIILSYLYTISFLLFFFPLSHTHIYTAIIVFFS